MLNNDKILAFLRKATIYEINTRQFSRKGDFGSVEAQLPRLKQMGVDILWFMPIHPIGEIKRKGSLGSYYCSRDFFDVNPEFGTKADFKKLVDTAHQLGMKIVLDWVANHAAWDNGWVKDHPDYFLRMKMEHSFLLTIGRMLSRSITAMKQHTMPCAVRCCIG
jgi:cyclomaltodextrinase